MYHPNNTPPKHIVKLMQDNTVSYESQVVHEGENYYLRDEGDHWSIYKRCKKKEMDIYRDKRIRLHECTKEEALMIVKTIDSK